MGLLRQQMEIIGFGTCEFYQTQNVSMGELREMVLDLLLSVTYPSPNHPEPELLRGIHWHRFFDHGKDDERRLSTLADLIEEGYVVDDDGYLSVHPSRAREAMGIVGAYFGDEEPPADHGEPVSLSPEVQEMIDLNGIEDTAEYLFLSSSISL